MAAPDRSGRPTDRPAEHTDPATEFPGLYANKGPERNVPAVLHPAGSERHRRVSRRRLDILSRDLSPRERAVLDSLDRFRLLTTEQLQLLHFTDHATPTSAARVCRRVLRQLARDRVVEPLERRVGGFQAGSTSFVWRVGPVGDRLLRADDPAPRSRRKEPSTRYLDHCLAIADCHCRLTLASRQGELELLRSDPEPSSWRRYQGLGGSREILKPDLFAVTATGDYEDHWFVEVDRGTESLPTLLRKCAQYETYRRTGREQVDGGVFPWVLWVMSRTERVDVLQAAIRAARDLDASLYRLTTPDGLIAEMTRSAA